MSFGKRLEEIMISKNLNYRSLGAVLNYSDTQIGRIIKDGSMPRIDFVQHFCNEFQDVDIKWLITGVKTEAVSIKNNQDYENISKIVFDDWDELMKIRLFKATFESKASSWAFQTSSNRDKR